MTEGRYADNRTFPLPRGWERVAEDLLELARSQARRALTPDNHAQTPKRRVQAYYDPERNYAGELLTTASPNLPNEVTAADLWAVSTLNVPVPSRLGRRLLESGPRRSAVNRHLRDLPNGLPITALDTDAPEVRDALNTMELLQEELRTLTAADGKDKTNRWVFAAKMCARKRPMLFPVRDDRVCCYLGDTKSLRGARMGKFRTDIQVFAYLMTCPEMRELLIHLREGLAQEGVWRHLDETDLRLLDVALWTAATE